MAARKTVRRLQMIKTIEEAICVSAAYASYNLRTSSETVLHNAAYPLLKSKVEGLYSTWGETSATAKAEKAVIRESDPRYNISHINAFGTLHRPDFIVILDGTSIAIEMKKARTGQSVRDGLGQSLVYAMHCDFVVYILIDMTPNFKIVESVKNAREAKLLTTLWDQFNVSMHCIPAN